MMNRPTTNRHRLASRLAAHLLAVCCLLLTANCKAADTLRLSLNEAIAIAHTQSVDAAIAQNRFDAAYWEYRTHEADQLPELSFRGTLPAYSKSHNKYQKADGTYTYLADNSLSLSGELSVDQQIALTGGTVSLTTSLDFTRQLGTNAGNEYLSLPVGIVIRQPVWSVNHYKWERKIAPLRFREAKSYYAENMEEVSLETVATFFQVIYARESLHIARQNLENAEMLCRIALAKKEIGHISDNELLQLDLSALQARAALVEAQSGLQAAMFRLHSFLGISDKVVIDALTPESIPPLQLDYPDVLLKAKENNHLIKNILRRQIEADYALASARSARQSIDLYASIGYSGKDQTIGGAYHPLRPNQVIEVGMSIPILDWGKRKGKEKTAESNRRLVLSQTKQEEINFEQTVFLLVENFNNQAGQVEIARQADRIALKRYTTSVETYLIGKLSLLDLNDAQRQKDEAKLKQIEELQRYWNYYYSIRKVASQVEAINITH